MPNEEWAAETTWHGGRKSLTGITLFVSHFLVALRKSLSDKKGILMGLALGELDLP